MFDENSSDKWKKDPQVQADMAIAKMLDSVSVLATLVDHVSDIPLLDAIIRQVQQIKREAEIKNLMSPQDIISYARNRIKELETDTRYARFSPHQVATMVAAIDELNSLIAKIKLEPEQN